MEVNSGPSNQDEQNNQELDSKLSGWPEYFKNHENREARPQLALAIKAIEADHQPISSKQALDIGAGNLIESKALLEAGFDQVTATDASSYSVEESGKLEREYNDFANDINRFSFYKLRNEELAGKISPNSADLIVSYYALPFTRPHEFARLWQSLESALKPGGVMSVTLFGNNDGWATETNADGKKRYQGMTFHSREQVEELLGKMQEVEIAEREYDSLNTNGEAKHWHVYDVQARKPAPQA